MGKKDEPEIIPPDNSDRPNDRLLLEGSDIRTRLVTTGQIKSEIGKMYRGVRNGKLDHDTARTCGGLLRIMLKATEQEHIFQLAADDPDDDTPSLIGVTIIGPGATPKQIEDMKTKVKNAPSTRKDKPK